MDCIRVEAMGVGLVGGGPGRVNAVYITNVNEKQGKPKINASQAPAPLLICTLYLILTLSPFPSSRRMRLHYSFASLSSAEGLVKSEINYPMHSRRGRDLQYVEVSLLELSSLMCYGLRRGSWATRVSSLFHS
jgi:hypothetical protein